MSAGLKVKEASATVLCPSGVLQSAGEGASPQQERCNTALQSGWVAAALAGSSTSSWKSLAGSHTCGNGSAERLKMAARCTVCVLHHVCLYGSRTLFQNTIHIHS